ncbi:MAG: hypothetical protein Q4C77_07775 [Eubacteriales bacterium]|nr:hypothetical protein [Eubacteriales bacterium]
MKRKYAAIILGMVLSLSSMSVYGAEEVSDITVGSAAEEADTEDGASEAESEEEKIYGEVSRVEDGVITLKTGKMKEMDSGEMPEGGMKVNGSDEAAGENVGETAEAGEAAETPAGDGSQPVGELPSMLELTGEEIQITVTDETVIRRQNMGMGGQPGGAGEAPEKPDGENGEPQGETPEKPDGENGENQGEAPEKPDGESENAPGEGAQMLEGGNGGPDQAEEITLDDISEGDILAVTLNEDGSAAEITVMSMGMGGGQPGGGPGGQISGADSYTAVNDYQEDTEIDGESFASTGIDENAIHVSGGASAALKNIIVSRESEESQGGDNSSFYGVGAAILTTDGISYIDGSTIDTDASGAAGIFAYGDGTVYTADTTITTEKDTSGGIHAAGGGTLYAWDMNIETQGESSAAIRSDRGGGTMVVDGGTYISNGNGSPAIYSTADIAVNNAQLTANGSEAICIEGLNSIHLYDSDLIGNMSDLDQNDCTWNVILYQSMSGDSEVGNSTFEMNGGTLTAKNGGMFYTTNTESTFTLSNVDITCAEDSEFFLKCTGNSNARGWGQSGANGADCLFTAINQDMEGSVIWDSISLLDLYMVDGSTLTGAVINDESNAGNGGEGYCNFYIGEDCIWTVTGDSVLSSLSCAGTIADENGSTVTVKGTDGTIYVEGQSSYTITVETYRDTADLSGASGVTYWTDYETEKPAELQE